MCVAFFVALGLLLLLNVAATVVYGILATRTRYPSCSGTCHCDSCRGPVWLTVLAIVCLLTLSVVSVWSVWASVQVATGKRSRAVFVLVGPILSVVALAVGVVENIASRCDNATCGPGSATREDGTLDFPSTVALVVAIVCTIPVSLSAFCISNQPKSPREGELSTDSDGDEEIGEA